MAEHALKEGRPYAMAFVDIRMPPGWDGVETINRIWKLYPELQVVICTAYSDYSWEEMIREIGRTDNLVILKKPFDLIEVSQLARMMVAKRELARQADAQISGLGELPGKSNYFIGNDPKITASLFAPGYTIASVIANEFTEATGDLYLSALIELGLVLFLMTFILNGLARILIVATERGGGRPA